MIAATKRRRWWAGWLVGGGLLGFVAATFAYGMSSRRLGATEAPFFVFEHRTASSWALPAVGVVAACLFVVPWLLRFSRGWFALASVLLAVVTRLAVNMVRHGPAEWGRPFTAREAVNEYTAAVPLYAAHPLAFLERFPGLVATLPTHPAGHPPGPTLLAIGLYRAGAGGPWGITAMIVVVGCLAAPLTFAAALRLGQADRQARVATLVWVFAPGSMLESVTSMDAVFATLGIGIVVLLVGGHRWLGGGVVWVGSLMSYSLAAVPVWVAVVIWRRTGLGAALRMVTATLVVVAVGYAALRLLVGYDAAAAFRATRERYLQAIAGLHRPQRFWWYGDLAAFLGALGVPVVVAYGWSLVERRAEAWALALIMLAGALSGYSKAEVERIWLFMVPLAALAVAPVLARTRLLPVLVLLAGQALLVEWLYATVW